MNCFSLVAKCKKFADEYVSDLRELFEDPRFPEFHRDEEFYKRTWDIAYENQLWTYHKLKRDAAEVAVDFAKTIASVKAEQDTDGMRYYLITVRPPNEARGFLEFKKDVENYVEKWGKKWATYTYVFEQKGENPEELGKGFHFHMVMGTETINYYPSHILRDLKKHFHYTAPQCIKVDKIRNLERAYEYIDGDKKSEQKAPAVAMDKLWRQQMGLEASVKFNPRLLEIENQ